MLGDGTKLAPVGRMSSSMKFFLNGLAFFFFFQAKSSSVLIHIASHIRGQEGRKVVTLLAWGSTMTRDLDAVLLVVDGERRDSQRKLVITVLVCTSRRNQGGNHEGFEGLIK